MCRIQSNLCYILNKMCFYIFQLTNDFGLLLPLRRCDKPCTDGRYGDGCRFLCKTCNHGHCDHVTGSCICLPGFQGERWGYNGIYRMFSSWCKIQMSIPNSSISVVAATAHVLLTFTASTAPPHVIVQIKPAIRPQGLAQTVCTDTVFGFHSWYPHPPSSILFCVFLLGSRAGLLAGLLIPLCILILALLFCCCCCGGPVEGKEGYEYVICNLI